MNLGVNFSFSFSHPCWYGRGNFRVLEVVIDLRTRPPLAQVCHNNKWMNEKFATTTIPPLPLPLSLVKTLAKLTLKDKPT